jgi:RND family efflux transporter MFP subunit
MQEKSMNIKNWSFRLLTVLSLTSIPLLAVAEDNHRGHDNDLMGNGLAIEHTEDSAGHDDLSGHDDHDHGAEDHAHHAESEHNESGHDESDHAEHGHNESDHDEAGHNEASPSDSGHEGHGHGGEHEMEGVVELNQTQRETAGIQVTKLEKRPVPLEALALGEIVLNSYATSQMSPRIQGQVVKRHARLGDVVKQGQALVTLSSVAMAEAQANALITIKEWQRVKKLGKQVVSERRFLEARIAHQQARSLLLAYGMTAQQAGQLIRSDNIEAADGRYTLIALQEGIVIRDDFVLGQMVEAGQLLFEITDESELWVEVRVNPRMIAGVKPGARARVEVAGEWIDAEVIQIHHALDEITRTIPVRLKIANPGDRFHPGQFVTASIQVGSEDNTALTLPVNAITRSPDGHWQVYVEEKPGRFEAREIDVLRQFSGFAVIQGLAPGTAVVTQGAFFVQSEQAKSGFDVHNH